MSTLENWPKQNLLEGSRQYREHWTLWSRPNDTANMYHTKGQKNTKVVFVYKKWIQMMDAYKIKASHLKDLSTKIDFHTSHNFHKSQLSQVTTSQSSNFTFINIEPTWTPIIKTKFQNSKLPTNSIEHPTLMQLYQLVLQFLANVKCFFTTKAKYP